MLTRADELRLGCVHGSSCHMAPSAFVVESSVPSSERVAAIKNPAAHGALRDEGVDQ